MRFLGRYFTSVYSKVTNDSKFNDYQNFSKKQAIHWVEPESLSCRQDQSEVFKDFCGGGGEQYAIKTRHMQTLSEAIAEVLAAQDERCVQCDRQRLLPILVCEESPTHTEVCKCKLLF